jgi:DNA-binding LacI/PurR family transcriptional regulator
VSRSKKRDSGALPRHITSLDVAKLAGVSRSAVSRTFTEGASVSPATRALVLQAAAQLGYHRNALAMGMFHRRSGIFGVITGRLDNPFIATGLDALNRRLHEKGLRTLIYSGDDERDLELAGPALAEYRIDGCFVLSNQLPPDVARRYLRLGVPLVVVFNSQLPGLNEQPSSGPYGAVSVDNVKAGAIVADHLWQKGRRRLAFVAGLEDAATSIERERGFTASLASKGASRVARASGGFSYAGGIAAANELLGERRLSLDAIFAANDLMALGVIDVARGRWGIRVPEELAVIGFDDIEATSYLSYSLSTVRQPTSEMISSAVDLMMRLTSEPAGTFVDLRLDGNLIIRESG